MDTKHTSTIKSLDGRIEGRESGEGGRGLVLGVGVWLRCIDPLQFLQWGGSKWLLEETWPYFSSWA